MRQRRRGPTPQNSGAWRVVTCYDFSFENAQRMTLSVSVPYAHRQFGSVRSAVRIHPDLKQPPAARDRARRREARMCGMRKKRPPDDPNRERHGFRGVPPPATFSLATLPDDALLTTIEVAAVLRGSTNTLDVWRTDPDHPLQWISWPSGFVRYTAGALRAYLALGRRRVKKPALVTAKLAAHPKKRRTAARGEHVEPAE